MSKLFRSLINTLDFLIINLPKAMFISFFKIGFGSIFVNISQYQVKGGN